LTRDLSLLPAGFQREKRIQATRRTPASAGRSRCGETALRAPEERLKTSAEIWLFRLISVA
jgi:hypothetical protein